MSADTDLDSAFQVMLGGNGPALRVGSPLIAGDAREQIFGEAVPMEPAGPFARARSADWLVGGARISPGVDPAAATERLYRDLFRASQGWHLVRIWNYVPAINAPGPGGLENYRAFCAGRAQAFERQYGPDYRSFLPSASAVGCPAGELTVIFAASRIPGRNVENPQQLPAYHYPAEYGPRSPSFARATMVPLRDKSVVFVSGTAAIRGHQTMAPGRTDEQLATTLDNLGAISRACGLGADLGAGCAERRHFKVYLRRPDEHPAVAAVLDRTLLRAGDRVSYVHADICRQALMVEIEAVLWNVAVT